MRCFGIGFEVNWDPIQFSHSLLNGSDYVVEVPQARWDHTNYYSDDDDCWKRFQALDV